MAKGKTIAPKASIKKTEQVQGVVVEETIVTEEPAKTKEIFTMDISDYGVKVDEAEKFVKKAIKFYFENKDKKLLEVSSTKEKLDNGTNTNISFLINKINIFEKNLYKYNYLPKKIVTDFIKDLKA